jgi:hypothetical protein
MKSELDKILEHRDMASKSVTWWEKEMLSVSESIQDIDELSECLGSDDRLDQEREILVGKFQYLFQKGRFEDGLLSKLEKEYIDYLETQDVKKKGK